MKKGIKVFRVRGSPSIEIVIKGKRTQKIKLKGWDYLCKTF